MLKSEDIESLLGTEDDCKARMASLWSEAEMDAHYPATTDTVAQVLRSGGGFQVNAAVLNNWAANGMVPNVEEQDGQYVWTAQNMRVARQQADTWRRFIPTDPRHTHKLSAIELAEAYAQNEGGTAFTDGQCFDIWAHVEAIVRANDADLRRAFGVSLKTKLRRLGVLDA